MNEREPLPAPAVPGLGRDRHRTLREHLMQEMDGATAPVPRRTRRRLWWSLAPTAVAAAAVAVALVAGAGAPDVPTTTEIGQVSDQAAAPLLQQFALVAEQQPTGQVRDEQYVYVKSLVSFSSFRFASDGTQTVTRDAPHEREIWVAVDGSRAGRLAGGNGPTTLDPNPTPDVGSPTYRFLESLPTDPARLLAKIYADTKGQGNTPDQQAFTTIGDLLRESVAPPKVTAALYRAAARIPGVVVVNDVVDAAGRHGVGVARLDETTGSRTEWIFDRDESTFLGEREVQVVKSPEGLKPGTLIGISAVLTRAIVDTTDTRG
ncbi:CU044_5270 family protein [Luedemannella flava]|uniref:CU044_5270 family protein n=1 Tax=Luedemannella flava TaxID=349316 RepID=A0ABP4Z0J1_9ACTN